MHKHDCVLTDAFFMFFDLEKRKYFMMMHKELFC